MGRSLEKRSIPRSSRRIETQISQGGIRLPSVEVDWEKCNGDAICVEICPVEVFELQDIQQYPDAQKSVPVKEEECILCMACVASCPTEAITVEE